MLPRHFLLLLHLLLLLLLLVLSGANSGRSKAYLWWEHKDQHPQLLLRLKEYSQRLISLRNSSSLSSSSFDPTTSSSSSSFDSTSSLSSLSSSSSSSSSSLSSLSSSSSSSLSSSSLISSSSSSSDSTSSSSSSSSSSSLSSSSSSSLTSSSSSLTSSSSTSSDSTSSSSSSSSSSPSSSSSSLSSSYSSSEKGNPLTEAFDRTNTHAFVLLGPNPTRAKNVRDFSKAVGFTESGGKYLTKITPVLNSVNSSEREELWANGTVKYRRGSGWVGRYTMLKAHMNTLQQFLLTNYTNALILEDDIMKVDAFTWQEVQILLADMLSLNPKHWDILYPGFCYAENFPFHYQRNVLLKHSNLSDVYFRSLHALCTHALVYNRKSAEIFLTHWMPFREALDVLLSETICKFGLKAIRTVVPVLHQDRTLSKSGTGSKDPLFPLGGKNIHKWAKCNYMLNATKARMFGLDGKSSVPPMK